MHVIMSSLGSALLFLSTSAAFQVTSPIAKSCRYDSRPSTVLYDTASDVDELLKQDYPTFYNLIMSKNADLWKDLSKASADASEDPNATSSNGFTIFAPNDEAMEKLGEKKLNQLLDDRNRETAEKVAAFHAVEEPVGAWELINSAGVKTFGGEVNVGKSKVGGFFGFGGKEDGGVTVSGAKIIQSKQVGSCVVHEMDGLISPEILWRYMDQLRIL